MPALIRNLKIDNPTLNNKPTSNTNKINDKIVIVATPFIL